jgi:hypothetical protein
MSTTTKPDVRTVGQAFTAQEVRQKLYAHMRALCAHWSQANDRQPATERERMEGLCFSVLNIFDGTAAEFPAMDIVLSPHESDKQFCIENGERYFEPGMVINNCMMHDEFYK